MVFTSTHCKYCNCRKINAIQGVCRNDIWSQAVRQNRILTLSFQLFKVSNSKSVQRICSPLRQFEPFSGIHYPLITNPLDRATLNQRKLKRLQECVQRNALFPKLDFFVHFRAKCKNRFTIREKVINKLSYLVALKPNT